MDDQARRDWLEQRRRGIGGSDMAAIMGLDPYRNAYDVWLSKVNQAPRAEDESPAILRGRYLEPIAAQVYTGKTGRNIKVVGAPFVDPAFPFMAGNIDRQIVPIDDRGPGVLEIKCPGLQVFAKCKAEGLPATYQIQVQHYLAVTGWQWGAFAVFNSERWQMIHFDVARDDSLISVIREKAADFWAYVEMEVAPPVEQVTAPEVELPPVDGEVTRIDSPEWIQAMDDYLTADEILRDAEALKEAAKNRLQSLMGDCPIVEGAGARVYWREEKGRTTLDSKGIKKYHPEIFEKFAKVGRPVKPFRVFGLK